MRVKLVIISKIAGINVNEVMNTSVCTGSDQLCPPPGSGWLVIRQLREGEGVTSQRRTGRQTTNDASGSPATLKQVFHDRLKIGLRYLFRWC